MGEITAFLEKAREEGTLRSLKSISSRMDGRISIGGREYIDFSSNDYLGLSGHPKIIEAAKAAADEFGASSSASRLLSGNLAIHHELEEEVARFKNKEKALVFNSGYQANVGILSSLYGKGDVIFSDRLNHASIMDGILLSGAKLFRFSHNDPAHLEALLKRERSKFKNALIITESVFSMDGDKAPLKALAGLKTGYDCKLMVDEAHATGMYGERGSGLVEEEGLSSGVDLVMGTFSKALGSFGAYLAASGEVVDYLVNTCRSFIYSTSLPPSVIAANLAALEVAASEPHRREKVLKLAGRLREGLVAKGFRVTGSSQIVPIIIGSTEGTLKLAESLQERGYWVLPIRPPTVPKNESRLRLTVTYHHDEETLSGLLGGIKENV